MGFVRQSGDGLGSASRWVLTSGSLLTQVHFYSQSKRWDPGLESVTASPSSTAKHVIQKVIFPFCLSIRLHIILELPVSFKLDKCSLHLPNTSHPDGNWKIQTSEDLVSPVPNVCLSVFQLFWPWEGKKIAQHISEQWNWAPKGISQRASSPLLWPLIPGGDRHLITVSLRCSAVKWDHQ